MKQQKPRSKTATKAKTAKTTKSTAKTVVSKKKTTKRKGVIHHTKRLYRLTPKFVHGMLIGAIIGLAVVSWIGSTENAHANPAANPCIKTNGPINVNQKNANVEVKTNDCNKNRSFVMKAWYAPSITGEPHEDQRLFKVSETVVVKNNSNDWTKINVFAQELFSTGCFYQVDLVDVTEPPTPGQGNPIVRAALGGDHDCTPKPEFSCNSMTVRQGTGRLVVVETFNVTSVNATLNHVVINWDYPNAQTADTYSGSPVGVAKHTYPADGTYNIYAVAYFKIKGENGEMKIRAAKQACPAQVTFAPVSPGNQQVCELKTFKLVEIPQGPYDTTQYGPPNSKECDPTITVTSTSSALTNTGPGAVLVVLAFAAIGGYTFHRTHKHLQARKHRRHSH